MMPGSEVLAAMARALGVPESYLLGQNDLTLESVEFRKNKITSRKDEASIKASALGLEARVRSHPQPGRVSGGTGYQGDPTQVGRFGVRAHVRCPA